MAISCWAFSGSRSRQNNRPSSYAKYIGSFKQNRVSFDMVVSVMKHTGKKIPFEFRETSLGGLAVEVKLAEEKKRAERNSREKK